LRRRGPEIKNSPGSAAARSWRTTGSCRTLPSTIPTATAFLSRSHITSSGRRDAASRPARSTPGWEAHGRTKTFPPVRIVEAFEVHAEHRASKPPRARFAGRLVFGHSQRRQADGQRHQDDCAPTIADAGRTFESGRWEPTRCWFSSLLGARAGALTVHRL